MIDLRQVGFPILSGMVIMDEGNRYKSENDLAAKRRLTAEEIERLPTRSQPMFQAQFKAVDSLFDETSQGSQPSSESFVADFANDQGILNEEQQPAIKKIRRFVGKTIDENKEDIFISALPDDHGMCLTQCLQSRPLCPNYACADPQFQASSFGPHRAAIAEDKQFIWSQDLTLRTDRFSRVCPGRRRHAICEELDNAACLMRDRRIESFNLSNISHELGMLTDCRKRKRSDIEDF